MTHRFRQAAGFARFLIAPLLAAALLAGCGGGGSVSSPPANRLLNLAQEPGAPAATNNTATDGISWFNYRRGQAGLRPLARNPQLDQAAQGHSDYLRLNNVVSHEQVPGAPGFTGIRMTDRMTAAGYTFTSVSYAGEVIAAIASPSGFEAAEGLMAAIYHRFMILEPTFFQAGSGAVSAPGYYTYFTTDFTADGLGNGLGASRFVHYPANSQQNIPTTFMSDTEIPDPVPGRNAVGYPISVHADVTSDITVTSFTVRPTGGAALTTRLLVNGSDANTPTSAAAIVPLDPLAAGTTHEVQFSGTIDRVAVARNWSFTTRQ